MTTLPTAYEHWMGDLEAQIAGKKLTMLALPGSHDSAIYQGNLSGELGHDADPQLHNVIAQVSGVPFLGSIGTRAISLAIGRWSYTQALGIKDQLSLGMRYLDLRLSNQDNDFYFCHSLRTERTAQAEFTDIKDWLDAHPKEIVTLDLQHFYNFTHDDHQRFLQVLRSTFGPLMASRDKLDQPLSEYWSAGQRLVVLYGDDPQVQDNPGSQSIIQGNQDVWDRNASIESIWFNKNVPEELYTAIDAEIQTRASDNDDRKLFVLQGILTCEPEDIKKNPVGSLQSFGASTINATMQERYKAYMSQHGKPWIFLMDFIEEPSTDWVSDILKYNSA